MHTPQPHLPPALSDAAIHALLASLHLPLPTSIQALRATAAFHAIYLLDFPASASDVIYPTRGTRGQDEGSTTAAPVTLVLRVAGRHIPKMKTGNEVAVMKWLRENTSVRVPQVVRFDASTRNPIGYEFTLLEKAEGVSVERMYASLSEDVKLRLVKQLTDVLIELNKHEWQHVGGLQIAEDGEIIPGPVLEDTFWMVPNIEQFWSESESIESLNPTGPYDSHAGLVRGYLERFIHAINIHPSLSWLADLNPRLDSLISRLPSISALSSTRLILSHKDLHFANIMATPDGQITAILDWEFATVVPALRWDPVRAFLWNGVYSDEAQTEKEKMRVLFEKELDDRGVERWWEGGDAGNDDVETVWTVLRFVRALVEVCPRKQREDMVEGWKKTAEEALSKLGV